MQVVGTYHGGLQQYLPVTGRNIPWGGGRETPPPSVPECGYDNSLCPSLSELIVRWFIPVRGLTCSRGIGNLAAVYSDFGWVDWLGNKNAWEQGTEGEGTRIKTDRTWCQVSAVWSFLENSKSTLYNR